MIRAVLLLALCVLTMSTSVFGTLSSRVDPTYSPTQFPTMHEDTKAPTRATKSPTRATAAPTNAAPATAAPSDNGEVTEAPTTPGGTEVPLPADLNATFASNDQQAVATLVGTTVPFLGLAGIAFGVYRMRRKRSLSESRMQNTGFIGNMNNLEKRGSAYNPGFNGAAAVSSFQATQSAGGPTSATALPDMPVIGMPEEGNNRGSKSKRLMEMVLRSRETAAFASSPVQQYDVESGLSKEQIEEKVKRIATYGARGYGTSANGAGLKSIGQMIAKMRPNSVTGDSLMRPSLATRASLEPSFATSQALSANQFSNTPHHSMAARIEEEDPNINSVRFSQVPPPPPPMEEESVEEDADTFENDAPLPPPPGFGIRSISSSLSKMRDSISQSTVKRVSIFGPRDSEPSLASSVASRVSTFRPKTSQSFT